MKKAFNTYLMIWLIIVALFNVITFITAGELVEISKFTASFWIGYVFIMVAFGGQFACAYKVFSTENMEKLFLNISLLSISYSGIVLTLIFGGLCMLIPVIPYWVAIIICLVILAFTAIAVLKATIVVETVTDVSKKVRNQTFFIKTLTVDAETLISYAKNDDLKLEAKKIYEAIRYSDPMSNEALNSVESQITVYFNQFADAIKNNNVELAKSISKELQILISDRNKKCMMLK